MYRQERVLNMHANTIGVTNMGRSVTKDPNWISVVWQVIFARWANGQPSTRRGRCNAQTWQEHGLSPKQQKKLKPSSTTSDPKPTPP